MKTTKFLLTAALALAFAACSNDDNDMQTPAQPQQAEGIPFTATISIGESAATRALSESGSDLVASWAVGDKVALIHNGVNDEMEVESVSGGVATITGTISSATDGDAVTVIYPATAADGATGNVKADLLYAQSGGTLADVAANYEVRKGTGTLKVDGTATLDGTVSLTNQFAIWKLTLGSAAKNLCIMADNAPIAGATLASAGTEFTVAVPAISSKTVTVIATDESSNCYYYSKDGVSLAASKYYQSSPTMTALGTDNSAPVYQITGTSSATIPAGKTAVFNGVNISGSTITCSGDATIILMGNNKVTGYNNSPAIQAGPDGTTLTITGTGSLNATGGKRGAGIGSGYNGTCGNITITGGTITASGGQDASGIGSTYNGTCGNITITGGTITATGGDRSAGIGKGSLNTKCGNITITDGVTKVTATKGNNGPGSIDAGSDGTVTIGGVVGAISESPYTYQP